MNLIAQTKYLEVDKYIFRGVEMERRLSPNGSRVLAFGLLSLGETYLLKSKMAEARESVEESVKLFESLAGENDPDYAHALGILGRTQMYLQNP
jgi:hypothetical protein